MSCRSSILGRAGEGREDGQDQEQREGSTASESGAGDFLVNTHYLILGRFRKFAILILTHRLLCLKRCQHMCLLWAGPCPPPEAHAEAPSPVPPNGTGIRDKALEEVIQLK